MTGRFGGAPAPAGVKFSFWRSMGDLGRLVMRSGAPFLRVRIALALGLVIVGKFAGVWAPVVLGDAVNGLRSVAGALPMAFVVGAVAYAGLMLIAAWVPFVRDAIFARVSQATMAKAAVETFQHSLSLSLDFHQTKQMGALSRIIDRGSRSTDFLIRSVVFNLGPTAIELLMSMAVFWSRLGWRFSLTTLVTIVVYTVVTFKITDWRLSHRREWAEADSKVAGLSVDALINYETVKTFGSEDRVVADYSRAMDRYIDVSVRANTSLNMLNGAQSLILNLGQAAMTVMAGAAVAGGALRIGDITMAILLLRGLYQPLGMLGFNYREIRQAFIDMEQMVELRAVAPDIVDAPEARALPPESGKGASIAFDHVGFQHDARSVGLRDVSFEVAPGTTTAMVGPSGSSKTTAVRLA